jgi:glycosyltransferase involved in cell wall biosynthesis
LEKLVRRIPFAYEIVQLGYNLVGIPMLLRKMLGRRVDFIYERYSLFNFAGVVVARLCGVPLILEVNSPFALEQSRDNDIRLVRLAAWTERIVCNAAAHVVVVSTPLQRIMVQAGIRASRLVLMPNGVDLHKFSPSQPRLSCALHSGWTGRWSSASSVGSGNGTDWNCCWRRSTGPAWPHGMPRYC